MSKTETAIKWMEDTANNDAHGYDQTYRWGQRGDYDCSAAVITAWETAGVPVKKAGASYTGNMLSAFLKSGFADVTGSVNLATGSGLKRGDVLLRVGHHTAMYCGNGKEVEASINEKGKAVGGKPGDQTGREFLIRSYRNYPWNHVLRFVESAPAVPSVDEVAKGVIAGKYGTGDDRRRAIMALGLNYDTVRARVNALLHANTAPKPAPSPTVKKTLLAVDGSLGPLTIKAWQKCLGVTADGKIGPQTIRAIQKWAGSAVDGKLGPNTRKAVQRKLGVTADGVWGPQTIKALQRFLNS